MNPTLIETTDAPDTVTVGPPLYTLLPGTTFIGRLQLIEPGISGQDVIGAELEAGVRYELHMLGAREGYLRDPFLRLFAPDGSFITENDDWAGTLASRIVFTPPETGTYFLLARSWQDRTPGLYELFITEENLLPGIDLIGSDGSILTQLGDGSDRFAALGGDDTI